MPSQKSRIRGEQLQNGQRRLEYLSSRLQDLAVELGDGQGAVWLKQNMWFLSKPALFFDDVLYGVGKICNHLVTYLTFHKQKLAANFPFLSFMGLLYEIGEVLGVVRDMMLVNPCESLSCKQSQIDLFWTDCTPFLFMFDNKNHLLLNSDQIPVYMKALMDLVPTVIQVGLCMYCTMETEMRGFECFAETSLRLSRALVETGEFLSIAEKLEPVVVPFLRQWILYALELVQNGVKARTDNYMYVTPSLNRIMFEKGEKPGKEDLEETVPKSIVSLSLSSSLPDDVAECSLGPLRLFASSPVRVSCQPFKWIDIAKTRLVQCPNESRKTSLEDICLRENQKLVSDIFVVTGQQPQSWTGVKMHCPLTKSYDRFKMKLFIKVKVGETWEAKEAKYECLFGKGYFLSFDGCKLEGFVAVEERPLVTKEIGPNGGHLTTDFNPQMGAEIPVGAMKTPGTVKMMIQLADKPREQQYRDTCPDMFKLVKSTSHAVELNGTNVGPDGNIAIKIPFEVLCDSNTKILVLRYTNTSMEVREATSLTETEKNVYTVKSGSDGGTVLATVDQRAYGSGGTTSSSVCDEMEVLLGKKQLCKLMIFVEHQQTQTDINQVVFCIVCAEKFRISEVLKEKTKIGLIEIPNSQSPDRLLQQADGIKLELKGNITLDDDIPIDAYTLTYLEGSDNHLRFPLNLVDNSGRVTFILRRERDNSMLHTFFYSIQDLLALIESMRSSHYIGGANTGRISSAPAHTLLRAILDDKSDSIYPLGRGLTENSLPMPPKDTIGPSDAFSPHLTSQHGIAHSQVSSMLTSVSRNLQSVNVSRWDVRGEEKASISTPKASYQEGSQVSHSGDRTQNDISVNGLPPDIPSSPTDSDVFDDEGVVTEPAVLSPRELFTPLPREDSMVLTPRCDDSSVLTPGVDHIAKHFADSVEKETVKDQEPRLPQALQRMSTSSEILLAEDASGAKKKDTSYEASLRILNRNSLVNLAKCISRDEGHLLGVHLGMRPEKVGQIYRMYRHSSSLASFYVLYEWRGRRAQAEMADRLIEGLRDIERRDLANVIVGVRKQNRGLVSADFDSEGMANVRRVSYTHARR